MTSDELEDRLLGFSVAIGRIVDAQPDTRMGRHVAGQLVRCGTSPAPNYAEGCAAESRADFIHKLSIVLKELRASRSWLRLILRAELLSGEAPRVALTECEQLSRIIGQSVVTAKANANKK